MAHIRRHGSGWQVVVYRGTNPISGKKEYIRQTVPDKGRPPEKSRKEAEKLAAKLEEQVETQTYVPPAKQTVGEYLLFWLEKHGPNLRESTRKSYATQLQAHVLPALGHVKLDRLTPSHLLDYCTRKQQEPSINGKPLSARSVQYQLRILHKALEDAVRWQLLLRNPAEAVAAPRVTRKAMRFLSPDEARRFLEAAREDRLYPMYLCALRLGLRRGELLGLMWKDIDFEHGVLRVVRQLQRSGLNPVFGPPKSERGRRPITLPSTVLAELKRWKARQNQERLHYGKDYANLDLVFCQQNGRPLSPESMERWSFKRILRTAGLPDIRFHDLRHSCATLLLAEGVHPKVVQELLGHSSISLTLDTYSHVVPTLQREALEKLDCLLTPEAVHEKTGSGRS